MTMPTPSDVGRNGRRATACFVHYAHRDQDGVRAIVAELETDADVFGIVLGLCGLLETKAPTMVTPEGLADVQNATARFAEVEHRDDA